MLYRQSQPDHVHADERVDGVRLLAIVYLHLQILHELGVRSMALYQVGLYLLQHLELRRSH